MKVMTAMYTIKKGGSYDRFLMVLETLLERGCNVHCISLTPIRLNYTQYQNHAIRIPIMKQNLFIAKMIVLFLFPFYILWIGRREKVDLFIAFGTLYAFIETIPKKILRKPMVTFLRGNLSFGMEAQGQSRLSVRLNRWIERIGINYSDTILSVSDSIQEEMKKTCGQRENIKWKVLPNHIPSIPEPKHQNILEARKKYGIPEYSKILVTAGVINRGKNLELLLKVLSRIDRDNLFLLIIGESSTKADLRYKKELIKLMDDLRVSDRVRFTGWIEKQELWEIFRSSDLFILPSRNEGMPNVMLEALGCNLPCFGSNIAGIRDILRYDELMFDSKDDKNVADKIHRLFTDRQFLDKVKRLCQTRKDAFIFDWRERVVEIITSTSDNLHSAVIVDQQG